MDWKIVEYHLITQVYNGYYLEYLLSKVIDDLPRPMSTNFMENRPSYPSEKRSLSVVPEHFTAGELVYMIT